MRIPVEGLRRETGTAEEVHSGRWESVAIVGGTAVGSGVEVGMGNMAEDVVGNRVDLVQSSRLFARHWELLHWKTT